jgi:ethanolamine ammonia-lyase small subunit
MEESKLEAIVEALVRELSAAALTPAKSTPAQPPAARADPPPASPTPTEASRPMAPPPSNVSANALRDLSIDLEDPSSPGPRRRASVREPLDPDGLAALMETTSARIGVGRAGPRPLTKDLLLFQADLAVTKDALARSVDGALLEELGLFTVGTRIEGGKDEYLLRPDLGRRLSDGAKKTIAARCAKKPAIQLCVGDGLSAQAIEANLRKIFPVIKAGCASAGLSFGTPFFIERCRVGAMNDIGDIIEPEVLILLIGERPGLGRADSMSAYMGYRPHSGQSDADRDVICNIFDGGGVNPLEAGAYALRLAGRMMKRQASGIKLKLMEEEA